MADIRDAAVTVVGGGAMGTAAAYFLARAGYRDIQVLEAHDLCSETSSQAAGFVGQARPTVDRSRLAMAAAATYKNFEAEVGYSTDFREVGALKIALSDAGVGELHRIAETAKATGLPVELIEPSRVPDFFPVIESVGGIREALWSPTDGYLQPNSLVNAYVNAARDRGVTFSTRTRVVDVLVERGQLVGLETTKGTVRTQTVVNAAGPWASALCRLAGVEMPIVPVRHEYFVTDVKEGWTSELPCLRVSEYNMYARGEVGRVLCGGFESSITTLDPRDVHVDSTLVADPDWEVLGGFAHVLDRFVPGVSDLGIHSVFRGWPAFAPDGRFIVGPVGTLPGLVMAAACNAHGVAGSAGLAMHLVESMTASPSSYVKSLSPNRFLDGAWSWDGAIAGARSSAEHYFPLQPAEGGS